MLRIYIDGASNPQKQSSAIGILILEAGKQRQISEKLPSFLDNHETEFYALEYLLSLLLEEGRQGEVILCHSDSKAIVDAIEKRYAKKESHRERLDRCLLLLKEFKQFYLNWIPERDNRGADSLARNSLYKKSDFND